MVDPKDVVALLYSLAQDQSTRGGALLCVRRKFGSVVFIYGKQGNKIHLT
jgi:hypothetical protein